MPTPRRPKNLDSERRLEVRVLMYEVGRKEVVAEDAKVLISRAVRGRRMEVTET